MRYFLTAYRLSLISPSQKDSSPSKACPSRTRSGLVFQPSIDWGSTTPHTIGTGVHTKLGPGSKHGLDWSPDLVMLSTNRGMVSSLASQSSDTASKTFWAGVLTGVQTVTAVTAQSALMSTLSLEARKWSGRNSRLNSRLSLHGDPEDVSRTVLRLMSRSSVDRGRNRSPTGALTSRVGFRKRIIVSNLLDV